MKLFTAVLASALLVVPLAAEAQEASLHDFETVFQNQEGEKVTLAELKGQPVLITMFYGNCTYACPLLVSRMRRIESKLPPDVRERMRMVLVTFDPKRDTVPKLKELQERYAPDTTRWSFLRVDDAGAVRELAAILGTKYRFMPDGSINHSSVITLLDGGGVVRARVDGMETPDSTILDALPLLRPHG